VSTVDVSYQREYIHLDLITQDWNLARIGQEKIQTTVKLNPREIIFSESAIIQKCYVKNAKEKANVTFAFYNLTFSVSRRAGVKYRHADS